MVAELEDFQLTHPTVVTGRADADFYPTPRWCSVLLAEYAERQRWWEKGEHVLDPCAGEGALLDVLKERGLRTHGIELDEDRACRMMRRGHQHHGTGDALAMRWRLDRPYVGDRFSLIVTNPPFSIAEAFVQKALGELPPRGILVCLLRWSWLEPTEERETLLHRRPPLALLLPKRPKYDLKGQDSVTSAWCVWGAGGEGEYRYPWRRM